MVHHGSSGAFEEDLWKLHAKSSRPVAVIAPFDRGASPLPDAVALRSLGGHTSCLAVTASNGAMTTRAGQAGLAPASMPDILTMSATVGPVVAVEVFADGRRLVHLSTTAAAFC